MGANAVGGFDVETLSYFPDSGGSGVLHDVFADEIEYSPLSASGFFTHYNYPYVFVIWWCRLIVDMAYQFASNSHNTVIPACPESIFFFGFPLSRE